MKTTFRIDIKQNGKDRLALASLYFNNHRMRGVSLHRDNHSPEIQSLLSLFKIASEHDDWANVNCAESTGELLEHLTKENGKTYQRTNIGGGITIKTATLCLVGIRVEGFVEFDPETVQRKTLNDAVKDLERLPCMDTINDGAHCGLADWYPPLEKGIVAALAEGKPFTTGWYGSKKEIAYACISGDGKNINLEARVYNDFDDEGAGRVTIPHTEDLEALRTAIYTAWDQAVKDQEENASVKMFVVGTLKDGKRVNWIETYLVDNDTCSLGLYGSPPPGDYAYEWGWQEGSADIPETVKKDMEERMWREMPVISSNFIMEEAS